MNRITFMRLLAARLYPVLRAEGFRGSGTTLRRAGSKGIHVFNFQGSTTAVRCYLNLGCHFVFLPVPGGGDAGDIPESRCAFRARIQPPPEQPFGWDYGGSQPETLSNVERIVEEWQRQAHPFFERLAYPEGLARIVAEVSPAETDPARLLVLGRIALHLGQGQRAAYFANAALARADPAATGLRHALKALVQ